MASVFISYRWKDASSAADRVASILSDWLVGDDDHVFLDRSSMRTARQWRPQIEDAIDEADVFVVVIGKNWRRGLMRDDDIVRREVELAIELEVPIVPLVVNGAASPSRRSLPGSIAELADWQEVRLRRGVSYEEQLVPIWEDIERIAKDLEDADQVWLLHFMRDFGESLNGTGMRNVAETSEGYEYLAEMTPRRLRSVAERLCELGWFSYSFGEASLLYRFDPE